MSVNTVLGSYYQLNNLSSGGSGSSKTAGISAPSLADALGTASGSSYSQDAYSVNLSPAAQSYLNGSTNDSFTLYPAQQSAITNILDKYKDAPFTQETFVAIQNDLASAGLGPDQLSLMDRVHGFNPTGLLMQALSGNYTDPAQSQQTSNQNQQTKVNNYLQSIVSQWQKISTTYDASGS